MGSWGCTVLVEGCSGQQSALNPKSADAALVADMWWAMLTVGVLVLVAVIALLVVGRLAARSERPKLSLSETRRWTFVVTGGLALPAVAIVALVLSSLYVGRDIASREASSDVTIEIIGKQWWWEVHYLDEGGNRIATTANEIHIPVDRQVRFLLKSDNVVHSFWAPNLHGKTDLIPGRTNETWVRAAEAGTYRGQCAEFCGIQHALMAFFVIAEPPEQFAGWLDRQSRPSVLAGDPAWDSGRQVFTASGCGGCHTIRGTPARGVAGPDLTHIAGRRTLAAGTIPNERAHMADWIRDPQAIKPGNAMPQIPIPEEQLPVLVDYLGHLQ